MFTRPDTFSKLWMTQQALFPEDTNPVFIDPWADAHRVIAGKLAEQGIDIEVPSRSDPFFGSPLRPELDPSSEPVPKTPSYTPPKPIEYLNADLAKAYGMDVSTAYQEALSNTSYQRAVKDLQAAGLNPVLAATGLSGAGGVYGAKSGSGVSLSAGVSSGHDAYNFMKNAFTIVGALAGYKAGGIKGAIAGASVGSQTGGAMGNIIDGL